MHEVWQPTTDTSDKHVEELEGRGGVGRRERTLTTIAQTLLLVSSALLACFETRRPRLRGIRPWANAGLPDAAC